MLGRYGYILDYLNGPIYIMKTLENLNTVGGGHQFNNGIKVNKLNQFHDFYNVSNCNNKQLKI